MSRYFNEGFDAMGGKALEHGTKSYKYIKKVKTKNGTTRYIYAPSNESKRKAKFYGAYNKEGEKIDKQLKGVKASPMSRVSTLLDANLRQINKGLAASNAEAMRQNMEATANIAKNAKKKKKEKEIR